MYSETWPRWGSMRGGECSAQQRSERRISESASSFSLPTLTASDATGAGYNQSDSPGAAIRPSLAMMAREGMLPTLTVHGNYNRKGVSPKAGDGLATALNRMPTLRATDGERGGRGDLLQAVQGRENSHFRLYPTLMARDWKGPPGAGTLARGNRAGDLLNTAVRRMPTLVAKDAESGAPGDGGPLNPTWCEWFMGFPLGWTELGDSAMPRFRRWFDSHGER